MEIDPWGRRFYHRGGLSTAPLSEDKRLVVDKKEDRRMREHYGRLDEVDEESEKEGEEKKEKKEEKEEKAVADAAADTDKKWKDIEFDMLYDEKDDADASDQVLVESFA